MSPSKKAKSQSQSTNSETEKLHRLKFHCNNLFRPKPLAIHLAAAAHEKVIATVRFNVDPPDSSNDSTKPSTEPIVSIVEIYEILVHNTPKLLNRIIINEEVTQLIWISIERLLTVSKQQTIRIYDSSGVAKTTLITDFGPILCAKYIISDKILLTGTQYGIVACYSIKNYKIAPLNRMVKISKPITSIEFRTIQLAENLMNSKKRKRESDDDEPILKSDYVIYGATGNEIVLWQFSEKNILETINLGDDNCNVTTLISLKSDLVVGDDRGCVRFYDHNTNVSRKCLQILQAKVLCIATNSKQGKLIVSGDDHTIHILKRDKISKHDYHIFDKSENHKLGVTSLLFLKKDSFISCGKDGLMILNVLVGSRIKKERVRCERTVVYPDQSDCIKFAENEVMMQYPKSLDVYRLPKPNHNVEHARQEIPVKISSIKSKSYIHASAISQDLICYSTFKKFHVMSRRDGQLSHSFQTSEYGGANQIYIYSQDGFMIVSRGIDMYIIKLPANDCQGDESNPPLKMLCSYQLSSHLRQAIFYESEKLIIMLCGGPTSAIYRLSYKTSCPGQFNFKLKKRYVIPNCVSFIAKHEPSLRKDQKLIVMSGGNQLSQIPLADIKNSKQTTTTGVIDSKTIPGLPEKAVFRGIFLVEGDYYALYDNTSFYKINIELNTLINTQRKPTNLVIVDDRVFEERGNVAVVEFTDEAYIKSLGKIEQPKWKFGR